VVFDEAAITDKTPHRTVFEPVAALTAGHRDMMSRLIRMEASGTGPPISEAATDASIGASLAQVRSRVAGARGLSFRRAAVVAARADGLVTRPHRGLSPGRGTARPCVCSPFNDCRLPSKRSRLRFGVSLRNRRCRCDLAS
jgi:hypothetical protein